MKKKTAEFIVSEETLEALAKVVGPFTTEQEFVDKVKELARQKREMEIKSSEAKVIHAGGKTMNVDSLGQLVVPVTVDVPEAYVKSMQAKAAANNITLEKYVSVVLANGLESGWYD